MSDDMISIDTWFNKKVSISIGKGLIIVIATGLFYFGFKTIVSQQTQGTGAMDNNGLEISKMIMDVKHELFVADSMRIAKNEQALFKLREFQMEINFTVRKINKAGVNVDYKLVTVEGGSETGNEKVQKLMLTWDVLEPLTITSPPGIRPGKSIKIPNVKSRTNEKKEEH